MTARASLAREGSELDLVVNAVFVASRALVAVAASSIASIADDVTMAQYRALVVLADGGAENVGALADVLGVHRSSATRMCDRLVNRGLLRRWVPEDNRREVLVDLSPAGRRLVDEVTRRRRRDIARIISKLSPADRTKLLHALGAFTSAAGELPTRGLHWQVI